MNYTYDLNDRLSGSTFTENLYADGTYTSSEKITGGTNYRYDNNGNLVSEQKYTYGNGNVSSSMSVVGNGSENGLKIYNYDSFNQLTAYYDALSSASYTYNADGLRMSKTVNGNKTEFTWDGQNLAGEETGDSLNTYTYDVTGISSAVIDGVYRTYMKDTHGSVVGYYNAAGERMKQYDYDAFGNRLEGSDPDPFGYCSEYYDSESGNIYLRARYYNSETGRFISEDPAKDGVNWYVYCGGDPVMKVDPTGLDSFIIYDENAGSGDGEHTMEDEANIRKKQLEETWGTNVQVFGVSNAWEFKEVWNKRVGYDLNGYEVSIEEVVIIAHGSITGDKDDGTAQSYFYFEDGGGGIYAKEGDYTVNDLDWKQMEWLIFSTCNSGNPDVYNLAYAFKSHMTINQYIVAWDGGTIFDYSTGQLLRGGYDSGNWVKDSLGQHSWYKYVDKEWYGEPKRNRIGYRQIKG